MTLTKPKRREDRRLIIMETTLQMIARGGVDSVTHRRVAAAAGIPLGSTTYYFESREHLIRAAFDHYLERVRDMQAEIGVDQHAGAKGLVDYLVAFSAREFENRDLVLAEYEMTLFAARDEVLAGMLNQWYDSMIEQMAAGLQSAGARRPREAARSVLHLMRGYELERLTLEETAADDLRGRLTTLLSAYLPDSNH